MSVRVLLLLLVAVVTSPWVGHAGTTGAPSDADADSLQGALAREILSSAQVMSEVQDYLEPRVPSVPSFTSAREWNRYAQQLRGDILERVVLRGAAARWQKRPLNLKNAW